MHFEEVAVAKAQGWSLAHSIRCNKKRHSKGTYLTDTIVSELAKAGIKAVMAYKLEQDDISENDAAELVAQHIAGSHCTIAKPTHGRCNILASNDGLACIRASLNKFNTLSDDIGIATIKNNQPVRAGQLIATIKVVPYGINNKVLKSLLSETELISISPYQPFAASLVFTGSQIHTKTLNVTQRRISNLNGQLEATTNVPHTKAAIRDYLKQAQEDIIMVSGISAISDQRDTLPSALIEAGGTIIQLGMPVDPGNLLMLGMLGNKVVIGMPGCAKSPALNGFDWVLERFAARLPIDAKVIRGMGIGGLLAETPLRPEPRIPFTDTDNQTAAVILAAGKSSRSGTIHKLLADLNGQPVLAKTLETIRVAACSPAYVVTGHAREKIASLFSSDITEVYNKTYTDGMGTSLSAGISALPETIDQAIICLADMPFVRSETFSSLQQASDTIPNADIFIPTFNGKRGNPVLWRKSQFAQLIQLSGDVGGRSIIHANPHLVYEVPVDDPGILIDLDTPTALQQFGITAAS